MTDLAEYLGKKYGGWYPAVRGLPAGPTARSGSALPLGAAGAMMVYRESMLKAAGFDAFPKDTDGFLKMCQALKAKGTPRRHGARQRDRRRPGRNWLMWAFGGKLVDKNNKVVIDSPETIEGARVRQGAVRDLHPRHAVVARPEQQQGVPRRPDQRHQQRHLDLLRGEELAPTRRSRRWRPTSSTRPSRSGRSGEPTESHLFFNQMIIKYTKYPKAAKEFLRFMMEKEQYEPWQQAPSGYVAHAARGLREEPDLDRGPEEHAVPRLR